MERQKSGSSSTGRVVRVDCSVRSERPIHRREVKRQSMATQPGDDESRAIGATNSSYLGISAAGAGVGRADAGGGGLRTIMTSGISGAASPPMIRSTEPV